MFTFGVLVNVVILCMAYVVFRVQFGRWHKYTQDDNHYMLSWILPLAVLLVTLTRFIDKFIEIGFQQLSRM